MTDAADLVVRLKDQATGPARQAAASIDKLGQAARQAKGSGAFLKDMFGGIAGGVTMGNLAASAIMGIGSAALSAAGQVANLVGSLATGILAAGGFRERAIIAFDALSKGAKTGSADLAKVRQLAFEMGAPFEDTAESIMKLRKMGFAAAEAENLFKSMQDMRGVGATMEETKRAIVAITQIKSAGKLQGDEMNQLAEAGVGASEVYKQLGKILGKTVPEVIKMKEAGKIDSDTAIKGIMAALAETTGSKKPGELGKKIANETLGGLLEKLKNFGGIAMDTIAEKVAPAFMKLKPILDDIMNALQSPEAKKAIDDIAAGVSAIFSATVAAWPAIKQFTAGLLEGLAPLKDIGKGVLDVLGPMFKALGIDAKGAASGARLLGQGLAVVIGAATLAGAAIAGVIAIVAGMTAGVFAVVAAFGALAVAAVQQVSKFVSFVTTIASSAWALGTSLIDGFVNGIVAGATRVVDAVKNVAKGAISAAAMTLKIGSPSKVFAELGGFMAEGMALGIGDGADGVATASSKMSLGGAEGAAGMGMGGGRGPVSIQVTIPVSGAGDPKAVAAEVQRSFLANLATAFEGLQAEAGA